MQSFAQTFVRKITNRTEKETRSFSERTMRSEKENDV